MCIYTVLLFIPSFREHNAMLSLYKYFTDKNGENVNIIPHNTYITTSQNIL